MGQVIEVDRNCPFLQELDALNANLYKLIANVFPLIGTIVALVCLIGSIWKHLKVIETVLL